MSVIIINDLFNVLIHKSLTTEIALIRNKMVTGSASLYYWFMVACRRLISTKKV